MLLTSFLQRLVSPEIDRLQRELNQTTLERDWSRELQTTAERDRDTAIAALKAERNRHLKREDSLLATIVGFSTGGKAQLPPASVESEAPPADTGGSSIDVSPTLTAIQEAALRERAKEYAAQREGVDEDDVYEQMKADPNNWLSN